MSALSHSVWRPLFWYTIRELGKKKKASFCSIVEKAPLESTSTHDWYIRWTLCHVAASILEGNLSTRRSTGQTSKSSVEEHSSGIRMILPSWRWKASEKPTVECTDVGWTSKSHRQGTPKSISQSWVSTYYNIALIIQIFRHETYVCPKY